MVEKNKKHIKENERGKARKWEGNGKFMVAKVTDTLKEGDALAVFDFDTLPVVGK